MNVPKKFQGIKVFPYLDDNGEKILVLVKIGKQGTEWEKKFSIKNLLDKHGNVTEQTLEEEKEFFRKPTRF